MSSSGGTPISYKPQVNRAITRRWAEAKQISYEGNDWGDDDDDDYYDYTPSSARGGQQPSWPTQNAAAQRYGAPPVQQRTTPSNRSVTNPSPTRSNGRQSFDRGDERRNFSAHAPSSSFEGPYPTAQRNPFPEPQHDFEETYNESPNRPFPGMPPLHIHTQAAPQSRDRPPQGRPSARDHSQYTRLPSTLDTRGGPYPDAHPPGATYGGGDFDRRSQSSGRPSFSEVQGRSESPYRTTNTQMSARSQNSRDQSPAKRFPPRKSSLSQDSPILDPALQSSSLSSATGGPSAPDNNLGPKPLPFIRPADIYKRMEEEREKERRSQESSRPSVDSNASRPRERDIFASARQSQESSRPKIDSNSSLGRETVRAPLTSLDSSEQLSSENKSIDGPDDAETPRKLKSTLDPVAERKSEYGFDNMEREMGSEHAFSAFPATSAAAEGLSQRSASSNHSGQAQLRAVTSASSIYSDRPDPVAASPQSSEQSVPHVLPAFRGVSEFGTDFLGRNSMPRDNVSQARQPATVSHNVQSHSSAMSGGPILSPGGDQNDAMGRTAASGPITTDTRPSPSVGLRSVVDQGFDDSQTQVSQTSLSVADSVARSNSASASDISPIISRAPSSALERAVVHPSDSQHRSVADIRDQANVHALPSAVTQPRTLQDSAQRISEPDLPPPPPPTKDDYRRDYSIPKPGNSKAQTPLTVGPAGVAEGQLASKSSTMPMDTRSPLEILRNVSEDSQGLEKEQKPSGAGMGTKELPLPPSDLSQVAAAGPSTRSTVGEIPETLDRHPGMAPHSAALGWNSEILRPSHDRLDSFRPSLPGGWQSYSTNAEQPSHQQEQSTHLHSTEQAEGLSKLHGEGAEHSPVSSEDDDIPVAGPPRPRRDDSGYGHSKTAFAAAAAAGSALVGAFTSAAGFGPTESQLPSSSEVSEDRSVSKGSAAPENVATKDVHNIASIDQGAHYLPRPDEASVAASPFGPSPPPKDTPSEFDTPGSTLGYFPLPLRTSRTNETALPPSNDFTHPTRPPMLPSLSSDTSIQDTENDKLRKEIVRTLTSKSTRYEGESARPFDNDVPLPQAPIANQPQFSNLDQSSRPSPVEAEIGHIQTESDTSRSSPLRTPTAPNVTNKELPQPNAAPGERQQLGTPRAQIRADSQSRPMLEQRFSWETPPGTTPTPQEPSHSAHVTSADSPRTTRDAQSETGSPGTIRPTSRPNMPSTSDSSRAVPSIAPADTLRHVQDEAADELGEPDRNLDDTHQSSWAAPSSRPLPPSTGTTDARSRSHSSAAEVPFRDILSLGTPQDRIQAFNNNRRAVASQDTGLEEWLTAMGHQLPEHSELLRQNGRPSSSENENIALYKSSPARSKFQRFASMGNVTQSNDPEHDLGSANSPSGGRNMPGQGKKLLKDAGKIGGQAGVVAKGLFAKGKSKLRAGGGSDKGLLAGRRRSSQPTIVIEEPQHSSITTTTAPQIPNLSISPLESEDQWYNRIDAASAPSQQRSVSPVNAAPKNNNNNNRGDLMLPGHVDRPTQQLRQSSPRVSAVGSFHDGEVPSRSISEVTRPTNSGDERSPVAPIPENIPAPNTTDHVASGGSKQPRLVTPVPGTGLGPTRAPVSDALGPLPDLSRTTKSAGNPAATDSDTTERDLSTAQDLTPKDQFQDRGGLASSSEALAAPQSKRHSIQSAKSSPAQRVLSEQTGEEPSDMPDRLSEPPLDTDTPPYAEPQLTKEAEAALYRAQEDPSADGLPAYETTDVDRRNNRQPRIEPGAAIIPVSDLSNRPEASSDTVQSRPFSFVGGGTMISPAEDMITEHLPTSSDRSMVQPDLAKEISVVSTDGGRDSMDLAKRKSKSYSRPFVTDPNVRDHPAYRKSQELARTKESFMPTDQNDKTRSATDGIPKDAHDDGRYRIPGPYVQEYRSPKQPPQALAAKQPPPAQTNLHDQPNQRPPPGVHPLRSHDPRSDSQVAVTVRPIDSNQDLASEAAGHPGNDRVRQQSKSGLFRNRSKSRSTKSRNDESPNVENKQEKRGGFFRQRTKGDGFSGRTPAGIARTSSADSREVFNRQVSHDGVDRAPVNGERADQNRNLNSSQPHVALRSSGSGNPLQNEPKKKRFSGIGNFFGRPGTGGAKTSMKNQGPQPVPGASSRSDYVPDKPDAYPQQKTGSPESMYTQNQQRHQSPIQPGPPGTFSQSQPGHQGVNAPIGGFYAPNDQRQSERSAVPHNPDSLSHGGYPAEQQLSPDPYRNQYHQASFQGPHQPSSQPLDQQLPPQRSEPEETRPPLQINTDTDQLGSRRSPNHHFVTAPPGPAPQFPLPSQSSSDPPRQGSYYNNRLPSPEPRYDSRQGGGTYGGKPNTTMSHAIDLHKRSRSPRNGRKFSEDERLEGMNRSDPASQLGTFSKSAAPRSGGADSSEQEAPWRIGLPNGEDEESKRRSRAALLEQPPHQPAGLQDENRDGDGNGSARDGQSHDHEQQHQQQQQQQDEDDDDDWRKQDQAQEPSQHAPTVAEKVMGVQLGARTPLLQRNTSAANAMAKPHKTSPVELPGSRAPGDDSDDEIVMSSTAYPGQEWAPENWGYAGNWDD